MKTLCHDPPSGRPASKEVQSLKDELSCFYYSCETTTFRWCQNPKYWKENIIKRHGLLRCKNGCGLWNRDTNVAINIWRIAKEAILQRERPEYLKRTKRSISGITSIQDDPRFTWRSIDILNVGRCKSRMSILLRHEIDDLVPSSP
jgi:hypothetical protein